MSAVPICAKARGHLLRAVADLEEFSEDIDLALPALRNCGVYDLESRAAWIAGTVAQLRRAIEVAVEQTTELRANAFPRIPKPKRIDVPVFRTGKKG
jgi:hypothetical protein